MDATSRMDLSTLDGDDDGDTSDHPELLPTTARLDYKTVTFITNIMAPVLDSYKASATMYGFGGDHFNVLPREHEPAWPTRAISFPLRAQPTISSRKGLKLTNVGLRAHVFQLMPRTVD